MKKIFFFACVVVVCSFCFGQCVKSNFDVMYLKLRMDERRFLFKEYLKDARNLVKDLEVDTICDFLEREAVLIAPVFLNGEFKFIAEDSTRSENYIFVMFVFKEELSLSEQFTKPVTWNHIGVLYNPNTRVLVIKTSYDISKNWKALSFLHEGRHAYESVFTPYDWKDKKQFCLHERTTHEFENRLLAKIGGAPYELIMRKEIKELEHRIDSAKIDWRQSFLSLSVISDLDKIFGKPKSEFEDDMRYKHFWVDKYFRFFDQKCKTKTEAGQLKDDFFGAVYINSEAIMGLDELLDGVYYNSEISKK